MNNSETAITRREFTAGLAVTATALGQERAAPPQPLWYQRIRRLGQTNINEKDAATLDVDKWVRYWASLKVDGVIASAGGIMAFYPTTVPLHRRRSTARQDSSSLVSSLLISPPRACGTR